MRRNERRVQPCGFMGDPKKPCKCAPVVVEKYMGRISGPLLDRIDLHLEVPPVPFEDLSKPGDGTGSAVMREQVFAAREVQAKRFGGTAGGFRALDRKLWGR